MLRLALILVFVLIAVPANADGDKFPWISLTKEQADVHGCSPVGSIKDDEMNDFKKKAYKRGSNRILIISQDGDKLVGEAYLCPTRQLPIVYGERQFPPVYSESSQLVVGSITLGQWRRLLPGQRDMHVTAALDMALDMGIACPSPVSPFMVAAELNVRGGTLAGEYVLADNELFSSSMKKILRDVGCR